MSYATIEVDRDSRGIVRLTLDRPDRRNAIDAAMIGELTRFARSVTVPGDIRAVVLAGRGPVFCAGADLGWMREQAQADRAARIDAATGLARMLRALNELPVPLIGRIHGGAFGGGIGLACICDVVVADETTRFALSETRLGLIPATIGPYVAARIGEGSARRIFFSGRSFDGPEAVRLGIVARTVPPEDLDAAVEAEVAPYLATAPGAVAAAKRLLRRLGPRIDDALIAETAQALADTWESDEAATGIAAFLSRTSPPWAGET